MRVVFICGICAAVLLAAARVLIQGGLGRFLGVLQLRSTMSQRKDGDDGGIRLHLLLLGAIPILLAVVSASDAALSYRYCCQSCVNVDLLR
jgi:hypothetical protein